MKGWLRAMPARRIAVACGLIAALAPASAGARPHGTQTYVLPTPPTQFPEGVSYDERSGRYYVSSQSNGAILTGVLNRKEADILAAPGDAGRTSANGLDTDRKWRKLWVATGQLGRIDLLNPRSGATLRTFTMAQGSYANDVAVTKKATYVTDSLQPTLWRVRAHSSASGAEPWLELTTTPITYTTGFNLNGIEATKNGHWLIAVQTNTGQLWRISTRTKHVREIALDQPVTNGDGLVPRGRTLWVVRNALGQIAKVKLSRTLTRGRIVSSTTDPSFHFPTTADIAKGRMLVVNSQFDRRTAGMAPDLPFTPSSVPVP
jgi:sugar lactone lactonase YvrE